MTPDPSLRFGPRLVLLPPGTADPFGSDAHLQALEQVEQTVGQTVQEDQGARKTMRASFDRALALHPGWRRARIRTGDPQDSTQAGHLRTLAHLQRPLSLGLEFGLSRTEVQFDTLYRIFPLFAARGLLRAGVMLMPGQDLIRAHGLDSVGSWEGLSGELRELQDSLPVPVPLCLIRLDPVGPA